MAPSPGRVSKWVESLAAAASRSLSIDEGAVLTTSRMRPRRSPALSPSPSPSRPQPRVDSTRISRASLESNNTAPRTAQRKHRSPVLSFDPMTGRGTRQSPAPSPSPLQKRVTSTEQTCASLESSARVVLATAQRRQHSPVLSRSPIPSPSRPLTGVLSADRRCASHALSTPVSTCVM